MAKLAHRRTSEMTNAPGDTVITHGDEQLPHLTKAGGGRSEMKAFTVGMATSGWRTCTARGVDRDGCLTR